MSNKEGAQVSPGTVHVYDDIEEQDNILPRWWLYTLYGAIAFAAFYWYGEQDLHAWSTLRQEFDAESAELKEVAAQKPVVAPPAATLLALVKTPATVNAGKTIFETTCASCHKADGSGFIGPNLTDNYWLHGSTPESIWKSVHEGYAATGMPAWGPMLGEEKVQAVVAYVLTLKGTNVAGGKAPQGDEEK